LKPFGNTAQHLQVVGTQSGLSPRASCCRLPCYGIASHQHILMPGATVWQQFRHQVQSMPTLPYATFPQSRVHPNQGFLPVPQCARCGLQTPVKDLGRCHHSTELCQRGWERKCQHEVAVHSQCALEHTFRANGDELERVEVFKYLGWLISFNDADNQATGSNLGKAQGCWS
jgi:hypothetical protein